MVSCQRPSAFYIASHIRFALMNKTLRTYFKLEIFSDFLLSSDEVRKWVSAGPMSSCEFVHCLVNSKSIERGKHGRLHAAIEYADSGTPNF